MKIKTVIKWLNELPEDYDVVLSRFYFVKSKKNKKDDFAVILDLPVTGMVKRDDNKEVSFMIDADTKVVKRNFPDFKIKGMK